MPVETALVVDDSKSARIMLSRMVQKAGLEVQMVESGEEAIDYLENNALPDVIFMDHMMPGMDGLETTRTITKNAHTGSIPIFMYTSKEGPEYEDEVYASGATGMLGKPAKIERLHEVIAEVNDMMAAEAAITTAAEPAPEPSAPADEVAPETETSPAEAAAYEEPVIQPEVKPEEEEEEMTKEFVEEVATPMIAHAIEDALQPLKDSMHRMETTISENQSDIRKLNSRQSSSVNMVTQPVLDASLKQTTVQLQNQITNEIKSLRDVMEQQTELPAETIEEIKALAVKAGGDSGAETAEKAASSAAEAVAAKVAAAQAQIQLEKDVAPLNQSTKRANAVAVIAIIVAIAALAVPYFTG